MQGRFSYLYVLVYVLCAAYGTMMNARIVWVLNSFMTANLFLLNVVGLLYFAPKIRSGLLNYKKQ